MSRKKETLREKGRGDSVGFSLSSSVDSFLRDLGSWSTKYLTSTDVAVSLLP